MAIEMADYIDNVSKAQDLVFLQTIDAIFKTFNGARYYSLGNHDLEELTKAEFMSPISMSSKYYSFDRNGLHFVVLDPMYLISGGFYIDAEDGNFLPYGTKPYPYVNPDQLTWLISDLTANENLPTYVFLHYPLFERTGARKVVNRTDVRSVLETYGNVKAVFQGHTHEMEYQRINGIHYLAFEAVVDGSYPDNNAYSIVNIYSDDIIYIEGFVNQEDVLLRP